MSPKNQFHAAGLNFLAIGKSFVEAPKHFSAKQFLDNLKGGAFEAKDLVVNYSERWQERSNASRAFSVARIVGFVAVLPAVMALDVNDFSSFLPSDIAADYIKGLSEVGISNFTTPESMLGGVAFTCAFMMSRFRENAHVDAYDALFAVAIGAQSIAIGAHEYATMAFAFAAGASSIAMMPEEQVDKHGKNLIYGFVAAGAAGILTLADTWRDALPLASLVAGSLAVYKIGAKSYQARPWNMGGNISNITAATLSTGSIAAIASSVALMLNCSVTIKENDIPVVDTDGNKLSVTQKANRYFKAVLNSEKRKDYLSRADLKVQQKKQAAVTPT